MPKPPSSERANRSNARAPWVPGPVPYFFWDDPKNRRAYMDWLGKKLKHRRPENWHQVKAADFEANGGSALFNRNFGKSVFRVVSETFPKHEWHEWLFEATPRGFWMEPKNRSRFLTWLGRRLGFSKLDDWYRITTQDFRQNGGREMLVKDGSPAQIVMDAFPNHDWKPWHFEMVHPFRPVASAISLAALHRYRPIVLCAPRIEQCSPCWTPA